MSWIGRVGVHLFHKEYRFLKIWYGGGGLVLIILMLLFGIQYGLQRKLSRNKARVVQSIAFALATLCLWVTYHDFRTDFTHNILKERFHLGVYLFWIGWISISLYLLATAGLQLRSEVQIEGR